MNTIVAVTIVLFGLILLAIAFVLRVINNHGKRAVRILRQEFDAEIITPLHTIGGADFFIIQLEGELFGIKVLAWQQIIVVRQYKNISLNEHESVRLHATDKRLPKLRALTKVYLAALGVNRG